LVVFFGCGQFSRPGFPDWDVSKSKILNIDHHVGNDLFGNVNLVDEKAAAVCELVYELFLRMHEKITKSVAINLLTGIFTDTGGFRHANTTARILEIAADLVRKGARIDRIAEHSFGKSNVSKLHAWGRALANIKFDPEKKMIYTIVTEEELAGLGATPDDLDGIASILSTVPEAKFAMLLRQRGDEVRGSLRSEQYHGIDVSEIARSYGGGGHKLAAGFKFKGKLEHLPQGWKIT
jgi:phosphoesterase RecJ-like protein